MCILTGYCYSSYPDGLWGGLGNPRLIPSFSGQFEGEPNLLRLHRRDHCRNAYDVHDAGHIVGQHMQRHVGGDIF